MEPERNNGCTIAGCNSVELEVVRHAMRMTELALRKEARLTFTNGAFSWKTNEKLREYYFVTTERKIEMVRGFPLYTGPHGYHVGLWLYSGGLGARKDSPISLFILITHLDNNYNPQPYSNGVRLVLDYPESSKEGISRTLCPDYQDTMFTVFWTNVDGTTLGDTPCHVSLLID